MKPIALTVENVILAVKELLTAWINAIFYYHEIYPPEVFERVRSFNVIVFKSRSSKLNEYVDRLVNEVLDQVKQGDKTNELIVLIHLNNKNYFKYAINFDFIDISQHLESTIKLPNVDWDEIYRQFNQFLFLHVQNLLSLTNAKNPQFWFKVLVNSRVNLNNSFDWVGTSEVRYLKHYKSISEVSVGFVNFNTHFEHDT